MLLPPYAATYATHSPYITAAEFQNAPTGVDVTQLVPSGGPTTNSQTLSNMILRASGWADAICNQRLAATVDTRAGRYRVRADGTILVPLPFFPVVGIASVSTGWTPSTLAPLSSVADVWVDGGNVATIPVGACSTLPGRPTDLYASVTYVSGWANTQLAATAAAGATSLQVRNGLGIAPGQQLALYSAAAGEIVTVATGFTPITAAGAATVPLTAPIVAGYAAGDTLTAMPHEIKQAVISLTCVLIKTRGAESIVMSSFRQQPHEKDDMESGAIGDYDTATDLLQPYRRVV